jgi:RHS repeat-associated protein
VLIPFFFHGAAPQHRAHNNEGGVVNLSSPGLRSSIIGLVIFALPISQVFGATADELRQALGPDAGGQSGELVLDSGDVTLPAVWAESAAEVVSAGTVRLSSGRAEGALPLGDTDFGAGQGEPATPPGEPDGLPDRLRFAIDYGDAPLQWSTLVIATQFLTNEFGNSRANNDYAELRLSWIENGQRAFRAPITLGDMRSSYSSENPRITTRINVDGLAGLRLEFVVADESDGNIDSALVLSNFYFSGVDAGSPPGDAQQYPQDVNLANGTYSFRKSLISVPGVNLPFDFSVSYNSGWSETTPVGEKWTHSYHWVLEPPEDASTVRMRTGNGVFSYFEHLDGDPPGHYGPMYGAKDSSLVHQADLTWLYVTKGQVRYLFDEQGHLIRITEPNGNFLRLVHDDSGRLVRVNDTRGQAGVFSYDDENELARVAYLDPAGIELQAVSFEIDGGRLLRIIDANGIATELSYDDDGNVLSHGVSQNGLSRTLLVNAFNDDDKVSSQKRYTANGGESVTSFAYELIEDEEIKKTTLTDPAGYESEFFYDANKSLMLRSTNVFRDATWRYDYDDDDNQTRVVEPPKFDPRTGAEVAAPARNMEYDDRSNMTRVSDAYNDSAWMLYDARNNLVAKTDPGGNTTDYRYDDRNNNVGILFPLGDPEAMFEFDERGLRTRTINRRGFEASFEYDQRTGELLRSIDPFGNATSYSYDSLGRVVAQTTPTGATTQFEYDAGGRLLATIDPLQRAVQQTYDIRGLVTERSLPGIDGRRARSQYEFDGRGLTTAEVDPLGLRTTYAYDDRGKMVRTTTPAGKVTDYEYDDLGLLAATIDMLGTRMSAAYDEFGRRTAFSFPEGQNEVTFEYDLLDRLTARTDSLQNTLSQTYNERGLVSEIINGRTQLIQLDYDVAGRVTAVHTEERSVVHELDDNGNVISSQGDGLNPILRDFDALDRLVARTDEWGNTISYAYDANGNPTTLTYSDGKQVHYGYDIIDRLIEVVDWDGNVTRYEYDDADNLAAVELPDGSVIEYRYDLANRMLGVSDTTALGVEVYRTDRTLNDDGLILSESVVLPLEPDFEDSVSHRQYGGMNEVISVDDALAEHDADGNLVSVTVDNESLALAYDSLNRLVSVNQDRYRYDADGLRSEAVINGRTVRYVNDPNAPLSRVLEEHDEQGNITARYVWGLGLVSRQDGLQGTHKVYHFDTRGSTLALTDLQGRVTDRYAYAPYGKLLAKRGYTANPFTYVGAHGVIADGNGLYFMRARYYEPNLRRFITRDELSNVSLTMPQTINLYAYAEGDPLRLIDPEGEFGFIGRAIAGALVGAAIQIAVDMATSCFGDGGCDVDWEGVAGAAVEGAIVGALGPGGASWGFASKLAWNIGAGAAGGAVGALVSGDDVATGAIFGASGGVLDASIAKSGSRILKKSDDVLSGFSLAKSPVYHARRGIIKKQYRREIANINVELSRLNKGSLYDGLRGQFSDFYVSGWVDDVNLAFQEKIVTDRSE